MSNALSPSSVVVKYGRRRNRAQCVRACGRDHRASPDADAFHNRALCSDPDVVLNNHGCLRHLHVIHWPQPFEEIDGDARIKFSTQPRVWADLKQSGQAEQSNGVQRGQLRALEQAFQTLDVRLRWVRQSCPGIAAPRSMAAASTRRTRSGVARGLAASWTST